jgi:shikimate kinase
MKTSIALIGFMGTGKTAVGRALARKLGKEFIELDALIEGKAGRKIAEIFRQAGEIAFRELEIEAVRDVSGRKNVVIACGGGVVLNQINIDRLKRECWMVYLTAAPGVILGRTSSDRGKRPLLRTEDRARKVSELLESRQPFYQRAAEVAIDTSKLAIDAVVAEITKAVKEKEGS